MASAHATITILPFWGEWWRDPEACINPWVCDLAENWAYIELDEIFARIVIE